MLTMTLQDRDAPRAARRAVADCCARAHAGPVCADSAAVMTSEVVTNALLHGSGHVTFAVDCGPARIRVEVGDDGALRPEHQARSDHEESGRGMMIVDALAAAWGVESTPTGKVVWFEVITQP